ncbi:crotonase/enoyl-CoA hydratase family protein [Pseudorhodoplanes sp.]|uniref:crotonase/enoyl-CoA hydratase family protein n=1 Tax=Pseudorhodoplanes sp. TaxID=1934341 RepID=UPI0039195637
MSAQVSVRDDGAVRILRMNRPEKKNALTAGMYEAMAAAIVATKTTPSIRCLVIAGQIGAFCAGNDLDEFRKAADEGEGLGEPVLRFLHALAYCERPMVAAVDGLAIGVGTTMLMHCDYVVASAASRFSTPFVGLGLVPEAASSLLAPRLMGPRRAFEMLVMGEPLDADRALALGLVNKVTESTEVEPQALAAAQKIASLPAEAVLAARRLIRGDPGEIAERIDEEADFFRERLQSPEARAAFAAFFARKR